MNEELRTTPHIHLNPHRHCISWSAIVGGALVAIGLSFLFNLLNLGFGLTTYTTDPQGKIALAIGGFIWILFCSNITMFAGGWVAGRYAPLCMKKRGYEGALHGFGAWCVALIFTFLLAIHFAAAFVTTGSLLANQGQGPVAVQGQPATPAAITAPKTPAAVEQTNKMGVAILASFIIFLIGAASAALGGVFGLEHAYQEEMLDRNRGAL